MLALIGLEKRPKFTISGLTVITFRLMTKLFRDDRWEQCSARAGQHAKREVKIIKHSEDDKSEFSRQGWHPVSNDSVSTTQRKAHRRCLAFCSSKGYETNPTAHLQPNDFLAQGQSAWFGAEKPQVRILQKSKKAKVSRDLERKYVNSAAAM